jgi:hypothetical protein
MKTLTVYTVSMSSSSKDGLDHQVIGSYLSRGDAVRACADFVLDEIESRVDVRYAFYYLAGVVWNELAKAGINRLDYEGRFNELGRIDLPYHLKDEMRKVIVDVIGEDACLIFGQEIHARMFRFDVDENDVEEEEGEQGEEGNP